jgi:hypothetical protein
MENVDSNLTAIVGARCALQDGKMSTDIFEALFTRQESVVDLTGSQPGCQVEESVVDDPTDTHAFCNHCLLDLTSLNFLTRLQHVKGCGNAKIVSAAGAMKRFLEYYGYSALCAQFAASKVGLACVRRMDAFEVERVAGVRGIGGKKKFILALEQYKESGRLQVRSGLLKGQKAGSTKAALKVFQRALNASRATSKIVYSGQNGRHVFVGPTTHTPPQDRAVDEVLLESMCCRPNDIHGEQHVLSRVSPSSLWGAAAECRSEHVGLEERLEGKRNEATRRIRHEIG